jgi:hypothetical protein
VKSFLMDTSERINQSCGTSTTRDGDMPRPHLVFITHSSNDTWVAEQIAQKIRACGADAFIDVEKINVGDDFEKQILLHLEEASELLALLTPWSVKSMYVWSEIGAAWSRRIPLVVVLHGIKLEKLRSDPTIPIYIKRHNLISLNDIDRYLTQLKQRVANGLAERLDIV